MVILVPRNTGCNEAETKDRFGMKLGAGQCDADCDCAPGHKCVTQPGPYGTPAGKCQ